MPSNYFPPNPSEIASMKNPAIQLFGNRLFKDQTVSELLVEFLLVVFSAKKIGESEVFSSALPGQNILSNWGGDKLEYAPKARLNLKLFSFLGMSRLESRHSTHRSHHKELIKQLKQRIYIAGDGDKNEVVRTIENLFAGFQGAGSGRTWCAQSFLPISKSFLAGESIWKETKAKQSMHLEGLSWENLFVEGNNFFDRNQHVFLARGGELIYLQLCNAFKQPINDIMQWCAKMDFGFTLEEQNPMLVHNELEKYLNLFMNQCPDSLSKLADFIDSNLDPDTPDKTDGSGEVQRFVTAGWCNIESWQEGYIFAVELLRLLKSNMGVIDKIYLLEIACAIQVLRSLAMQSARTLDSQLNNWPGYWFAVSAPEEKRAIIKRLSQQSVKEVEKLIFNALRNDTKVTLPNEQKERESILKRADSGYGGKLFLGLSKRIGFIVPKRSVGARFILNDQVLRLLVVTTVPPGERLTFDTFKVLLERRYGLVFDADGLMRASQWLTGKSIYLSMDTDAWLQNMLDSAGFLIHLSDSFALVHNPTDIPNN